MINRKGPETQHSLLPLSSSGDGRSKSKSGRCGGGGRGGRRAALLGAWVVVLLLLGARTLRRNQDWQDDEALYSSGVSVCPPKGKYHLETHLAYLP